MEASRLIPSREERENVKREIYELVGEVRRFLSDRGVEADVKPAGSCAVGTFVSGEHDYDVFVLTDDPEKTFALLGGFAGDMKRKAGELRIWNFKWRGADVDLVVVPRRYEKLGTLKHAEFYSRELSDEMKDEVVKGKLLFKSFGAYGAEIGGITGVAIQELIRRKGDLKKLCEEVVGWEAPPFVQDPVLQRRRSLTASIHPVRLPALKKACQHYLERGLTEYKPYTIERFVEDREREGMKCVVRRHGGDRAKAFTMWLSRCERRCNELRNLEGEVYCRCDAYSDKERVAVCFKTDKPESPYILRCVDEEKAGERAVEQFKKRHPNWFKLDGKVCALAERKIKDYDEFMMEKLHGD